MTSAISVLIDAADCGDRAPADQLFTALYAVTTEAGGAARTTCAVSHLKL